MSDTSEQWDIVAYVVAQLHGAGYEGYIVGGAVRDVLLGRQPKDFDVVTDATPEQVMSISTFDRASFTDSSQAYGVVRVKVTLPDGIQGGVEVATYRRDVEAHLGRKLTQVEFTHIEDDLERRDFTVNALALDMYNDFLVDMHDGLNDLEQGVIRFIGDPDTRISEDPLRILRGVRFCSQLGFSYDPQTENAIKQAVARGVIKSIAPDRVYQELTRILLDRNRMRGFEDLYRLGILGVVLPEVVATHGVQQPVDHHSEGDVWAHTMLALDALPEDASPRLAWATLLHDIGKAPTYSPPKDGQDRIRFDNHFRVGADMARNICGRLNMSKKLTDGIVWLVHHHMVTDSFPGMKPSRRRHYMDHPAFSDLLELHAADMRGAVAARSEDDKDDELINALESQWREYKKQSQVKLPTLKDTLGIDGHWVMQRFGVKNGEQLGQILRTLQEAFVDGDITTEQDAEAHVNAVYSTHGKSIKNKER